MNQLIYQTSPVVTLATNRFINVPIILQYEDAPLISIIKEASLGYTTEIPIYHADGTYLAKVQGTRIYPTEDGKKAGLEMSYPKNMTVCSMAGRVLFEIYHQSGSEFKTNAELHTPDGYFVKSSDAPVPEVISTNGQALRFGGAVMSHNTIQNSRIGMWLKRDGTFILGAA